MRENILIIWRKVGGFVGDGLNQAWRKRANKEKILGLLAERGPLGNVEIREILGISDRTVTRYMDELEGECRVRQMGNTGRGVVYELN